MIARTIRTPRGARITPRRYLALHQAMLATDRANDCEYAHLSCAAWLGGPCSAELAAEHEPTITEHDDGEITCACGNSSDTDGFHPCTPEGVHVEPSEGSWDGFSMICDGCGHVFNLATGKGVVP